MSIEFFLIKLAVVIALVVGLSLITERVSPKIAGILAGYPTGSALSLFFFGLQIGPAFAAHSAIYNMIGLVAANVFLYCYYRASKQSRRFTILWSSLIAMAGYFITISLLSLFHVNIFIAVLIPIVFVALFAYLLKDIKDSRIKERVRLSSRVLLFRAICAGGIILLITSIPQFVGSTWAGLFSAFPTTVFPLLLIIHYTYDRQHVHTIIKHAPIGYFSLILYSLSVSIVYPIYGIYRGTLISFAVATIYLILYNRVKNKIQKNKKEIIVPV